MNFLHQLYSPQGLSQLMATYGTGLLLILACVVYAETGLMVGFFLPGDSLLVTMGVLSANPGSRLSVWLLIPALCVAAIAGDNTGYWFGRKSGPALMKRPDSLLFKRKNLEQARVFYEKHGAKTIVMARFVPIVRTFAPIVAGATEMPYRRFLPFSIGGGIAWISSMLLIGHFLGVRFPALATHIDKLVIVIVVLSVLPMILHALQERKAGAVNGKADAESKR
jgi:membrane-associated protein